MQISEVPPSEAKPVIVLEPDEAILVVNSTIPGMVFESNLGIIKVDPVALGIYHLHLQPGTHMITFKAPGYATRQERFWIDRQQAKLMNIETVKTKTGSIFIETDPMGAQIILNGEKQGYSPLTIEDLHPGAYSVNLLLKNFVGIDTIVTIEVNRSSLLNIQMAPLQPKTRSSELEKLNSNKIWTLWKGRTYRDLNSTKVSFNPYCTLSSVVFDLFGLLSAPLVVSRSPLYQKVGIAKLILSTSGLVALSATPYYEQQQIDQMSPAERQKYDKDVNLGGSIFLICYLSNITISLLADLTAQSHDNDNLYKIHELRSGTNSALDKQENPEVGGNSFGLRLNPYYNYSGRTGGLIATLKW